MNVDSLAAQLASGGIAGPLTVGVAFLGGLVAGFGPCVLPMLPAVFGYVTGQAASTDSSEQRRAGLRGLVQSLTFVLGTAVVFSAIGAAAGLLGRAVLVGASAYYAVAAVCVVLGLQMLGVLKLPLDRLSRALPMRRPERRGLLGAFAFGMLFGLVASPCSTPILAAIATMAAASGSALTGAGLLFVYGIGKGVPLLLLGFASGSLSLMRSLSRVTPALTAAGGAALVGVAGYLVWVA